MTGIACTIAMRSATAACNSTGIRVGSNATSEFSSATTPSVRGGMTSGTACTRAMNSPTAACTSTGIRVGSRAATACTMMVTEPARVVMMPGRYCDNPVTRVGSRVASSWATFVMSVDAPPARLPMSWVNTSPNPVPVSMAVDMAGPMSTNALTSIPSGLTDASSGPTAVKMPTRASRTRNNNPTSGESSSMPNALPRSAVKSPRANRADKPSTADEARSTTPTSLGPTTSSSLPRPFAVASTTGSRAVPMDSLKLPHLVASFSAAVALAAAAPPT